MLRTLLSPRVLVLHLLAVCAFVVCGLLGRWQLGVFEESGRPHAARDPAPVDVTALTEAGRRVAGEAAGRRVTARGVFDPSRQLLVAGREEGPWLLTALDLGDGTAIPVVRGRVSGAGDPAAAVPPGEVTVTGRLRSSEAVEGAPRRTGPLPAGQVATVTSSELINIWRGAKLRDGFVVATAFSPAPAVAAGPVPAPPPTESGGFTWRNLAYAAQWWIFGLFAVFMWWHFVRDILRGRTAEREAEPKPTPA
ncbi:SURF1-like protein [Streptosporangium violaceochromogenes]|nr:SURF1-like protein [Streptosporangium violaceochromogenes]